MFGRQSTFAILFIALNLFSINCLAQSNPLIDSVDIEETKSNIYIKMTFNVVVNPISHFPLHSGKQLDIIIQPVAATADGQATTTKEQRLGFKSTSEMPLTLIRYEPNNPAGKVISLLFNKTITFSLNPQGNPRVIIVSMRKPTTKTSAQPTELPLPTVLNRPEAKIENTSAYKYTINLTSSLQPAALPVYTKYPSIAPYYLYPTEVTVKNKHWYRTRLGFYKSKQHAESILKKIRKDFPYAWVDRAIGQERQHIKPWLVQLVKQKNKIAFVAPELNKKAGTRRNTVTTKTQQMFAQAKKLIIESQYRKAIRILTHLLRMQENESSEAAQELLGVAREKNHQIAHAIAEYRTYLKKYPQGEFHFRVKQRLDGLTSAKRTKRKKLRRVKKEFRERPLQVYGSVFQFYRQDVDTTDPSNNITTNSSFDTDVSVSTRKRTKKYDMRSQLTGSYQYDLENSDQSQFRISSMYLDIKDRKQRWNARIGRQSQSTGGILGRFDGFIMGYRFNPKWKVNAFTGFPVNISSSNQLDTDKSFIGASIDIGTYAKYWNGSFFAVKQTAYDLDDRTAVGAELRYLNPKVTIFGLIDYDVNYKSLNIAQLVGNFRLPDNMTMNLVADYRNSPVLTTSNALQGQTTASNLSDLSLTLTEDQIRQLAADRTAVFRSVSAILSRPLKKDLLLNLEMTASHLEGTPASGSVAATPSSGIEYYYATQVIANNIFKPGDTTLMGLRYADTNASNTVTLSVNSRYPHSKNLRFNPRLRIDFQTREANSEIVKYRPSFRIDWRARRKIKFEMEAGYEYSDIQDNFGDRIESNFFINIGYIADF